MARNYFFYIALFFTVFITVGSLTSIPNAGVPKLTYFDKIVHTSAYFLLTTSWLIGVKISRTSLKNAFSIAFLVFVYGIIIEVLQGAITNQRQADIYDVLANFIGVSTAFIVFVYFLQKKLNEIKNILAKVILKLLN
ncbi:VanZ family protein [Lutibacter holmesii]|uniref:VanZ family protein n=1 Tax=Lutibacter holmesii TaxID=1137985 RepID=A0ABW3WM34_9FLAO